MPAQTSACFSTPRHVSGQWWRRGDSRAGQQAAPQLVDAFLADFELPFETEFWAQPAMLIDEDAGTVFVQDAPLSELFMVFCDLGPSDRSHHAVLLTDGGRFGPADMEAMLAD